MYPSIGVLKILNRSRMRSALEYILFLIVPHIAEVSYFVFYSLSTAYYLFFLKVLKNFLNFVSHKIETTF